MGLSRFFTLALLIKSLEICFDAFIFMLGVDEECNHAFFSLYISYKIRDKLNVDIVKAKDRSRLKVMISHPTKST
jgi:predicted transport protein